MASGMGGAPEFKDQVQAQRIRETILGRYNEILGTLQTDPDALDPIFWSKDDGTVIVEDWAMGFLDGIQLRLKQWVPLLKPDKQGVLIVPIAMHWFDKVGENVPEPNFGIAVSATVAALIGNAVCNNLSLARVGESERVPLPWK
jgi:yecA family protein